LTTTPLPYAVLAAPAAFALIWLAASSDRGRDPQRTKRVGGVAGWFGVAVAVVAAGAVAVRGPLVSTTIGIDGLGLSVRLDSLSMVMLTMISVLAVVIFRYSCTYLEGDARHGVFLGRLAITVMCVEVLVLAGNLALLVGAWIATSLALHRLLLFYPDRRAAVVAARKKFVAARIGDTFLIGAAVLLYHRVGTGDLSAIFETAPTATRGGWAIGTVELAALCIAVAAVLKSAQFPTHGWLVEVMETPTPVSALLHAGILNAGPFLALRMAFVLDQSAAATALLIAIGGFTAVFASVVLLTQPSVKVALGYSSAAHMGFMLMVAGIGIFPAVLLHLVAHSFYKAHAFLSSGSVIDEIRAAPVALPRRLGHPARLLSSAAIALAIYAILALTWGIRLGDQPVLIAVGAILVLGTTQIIGPALDSDGPMTGTMRAAVLAAAVTVSFFTLESGMHWILGEVVPDHGTRTGIHAALIAVIVASFAMVIGFQLMGPARPPGRRRRRLAVHLRNGLYANAVFDRLVGSLRVPTSTPGPAR